MKRIVWFLVLVLALTLFWCSNSSAAATADCELTVDWSSLQISGGTYDVGWNYRGLNSETWINGPEDTNPGYAHSQSPWQSEPLSWTLGNSTAYLSSSDQEIISKTSSSSRGDGDQSGWINANNHRGMSLALLPGTTYTFSLDYAVLINLSRENADQENASNYAQVALWLTEAYPHSDRIQMEVAPFSSNFSDGSLDYIFGDAGSITLIVTTLAQGEGVPYTTDENSPLFGYDRYWFETHLHSSTSTSSTFTPIPIPAPLFLLASGLVGLVGLRRRFGRR